MLHRALDVWKSISSPQMRALASVLLALTAAIAVGTGGCSSSSSPGSNPTPTPTVSPTATGPTPTPTPAPQNFVSLDYRVAPTTDPTYGQIGGYGLLGAAPTASPVTTPAPSQVITVTAGQTIVFLNFDRAPHTASLLGPASGMNWPSTFNNTNGASQSSAPGTAITSSNFSTGNLVASGGTPVASQVYSTGGVSGMFYFGDFYNYLSTPAMRTVIIIP